MLFFMGASACGLMRDAMVQQRYANAQREARRALRVPMGHVRVGEDPRWEVEEQEFEAFSCFHLCLTCGYLAETAEDLCPGCGHSGWTDLRNVASADAIRKMERRDRRVIPADIAWKSRLVSGAAGGAAAVGLGLSITAAGAGAMPSMVLGALAFGSVMAVGTPLVSRLWTSFHFRRRPAYPSRWHLPVPQASSWAKPASVLTGPAVPHEELLIAPVSQRPCIGYELTVLFDTPGDLRPPMWILEEEKSVAFEIDGTLIDAGRATLKLPATLVGRDDGSVDSSQMTQMLRQRGLFSSEGDYLLYEAIIEVDESYRLELHDEPRGAAAVVRKG